MPSLASSSQSSSFSSRGIFATIIVVLVILGFVFLPELLHVERGAQPEEALSPEETMSSAQTREPLERTANVNVNTRVPPEESQPRTGNYDNLNDNKNSKTFDVIEEATWEAITGRAVSRQLKDALRGVEKTFNSLQTNVRGIKTRELLLKYKGEISLLDGKGKQSFESPQVALETLYSTELSITRMMVREKVDRASRIYWSRVNLGEALQVPASIAVRKKIIGPFMPEIRLQDVKIYQLSYSGHYNPSETVSLEVKGTVKGSDVESIELVPVQPVTAAVRVSLPRNADLLGLRRFSFRAAQPAQNVTFLMKAQDIDGNLYQKAYNFYPRVAAFRWLGQKSRGAFDIPFEVGDIRMDSYFSLGTPAAPEKAVGPAVQRQKFFGGGGLNSF